MLNIYQGRRDFLISVVGRVVSGFGDEMALVALTLRLQSEGAHPYEVGLLLAAGVLPVLLMARPVGRLVDSHDSRRLLVFGGAVEVAVTIPLAFLHAIVPIVLLVGVLGAAAALTAATWSALIPQVVGEDQVPKAVSVQQSTAALVLICAPAVGGLLTGAFGAGVPMAVDAATFLVMTLAAALVRTRRAPGRAPLVASSTRLRGGFGLLRGDPVLGPLFAGVALVIALVGMVDVVLVYLIRDTFRAGAAWYGLAQASWMAGMVAGSLGAGRVRSQVGQVRATIAGIALACAALSGFAMASAVWMLAPLSTLGGAGNGLTASCLSTLLVLRTPADSRGRVSATANGIVGAAQGMSLMLGGVVALALAPREIYAAAGLLGLATAGAMAAATSRTVPRQAVSDASGN